MSSSSSASKAKTGPHPCKTKSSLSNFVNMNLHQLIEMGKKMRPSAEKMKEITDGELCEMMQKNSKNWFAEAKFVPIFDITEESLPKYFRNTQQVKLYKIVDEKVEAEAAVAGGSEAKEVDDAVIEGITRPRFVIGPAGSSQPFRCFDYAIPSIHHLTNGARFWVIIGESSNTQLEKLIAEKTGDGKPRKPGCLGGEFLMEMSELTKHQIEFRVAIQREGDTIVTLPGVYYYWVNLIDFTEVMLIHFTDIPWFVIRNKIEENRCSCRNKFTLNWAKMEEFWKSSAEADEEENISTFPSPHEEGISTAYTNAVKNRVKKRECQNKRSRVEDSGTNGKGEDDDVDNSNDEENENSNDDDSEEGGEGATGPVEVETDLTKPLGNMTID